MKPNATAVSAPVPGMGLTSKLGSRPWQRPPEFTTLEEAVPFYMSSLNSKKFMNAFLDSLEAGIPVTSLVDTMTQAAVLEGKHTIDISVLVAPIMLEALITLAERSGIDYVSGLEDADDDEPMSETAMRAMLKDVFDSPAITEEQLEAREEVQETVQKAGKGLMAKRGKE